MDFRRQIDIFDPSEHKLKVIIIGAGSVGSFTALTLAKMGIKYIYVLDDDKVEEHNIPNQFYDMNSIGVSKVECLKSIIEGFCDITIHAYEEKLTKNTELVLDKDTIVISCVDNMKTRKIIFDIAKQNTLTYYIDSRMGGQVFKLYTTKMNDKKAVKEYSESLHTDKESDKLQCTERTIIYNVLMLSSFICNNIRKIALNKEYNNELIFDFETMTLLKD